ncbi:8-oxo-dGTP pyrophosphatase MutT (NUDIX family) [Arcanobacterium wilhelmae]|uniref:8-oxo-dGTP pyrophosphatase MutT (NUDIX family) n=1 Tax=Arcanobacterium wilhelmae TaxID=1803177 RepID=A0ABT9NAD6_9ACTO|nr:NUDIX domain-containing protein [Arcanobacterium wilhelmae]MDP9800692.1 8-oxo-dGTP pyrophosphatase MutT (NUDIX family) [Arcanobacterium wilhelmae]WFN90091.1 NUDIX domain-containing protein [Arcanobacterium wilhelmae]
MNENLPGTTSPAPTPSLTPAGVLAEIAGWPSTPNTGHSSHTPADFAALVRERGEGALFKGIDERHLTASAIVLSEELDRVLLVFHKKALMWLQPGGHLEPTDGSLRDAGLREAREETGLREFSQVLPVPADINVHQLGGGFTACREHWDVGFVVIASADADLAISDESAGLRWFPVDALPEGTDVGGRVRAALTVAQAAERRYIDSIVAARAEGMSNGSETLEW